MLETPPVDGVSDIILIIEAGYASDDRLKIHAQFQIGEAGARDAVKVFHVEPTADLFAVHLGAAASAQDYL